MNQGAPFVISEFANSSGKIVFCISGWLDGRCIRKNFSTRAEAEAERQALEGRGLQGATDIRTAATRLVEDQLHTAKCSQQARNAIVAMSSTAARIRSRL